MGTHAPGSRTVTAIQPAEGIHRGSWLQYREWIALAGVLGAVFCVELVRLSALRVLEDEGAYLWGGRLIARGAAPYRDFFLAHPPGLMLLVAGWFQLAGESLTGVRVAYLVLVLAGTVPLYAVARALTGRWSAGLIAVSAYVCGLSHPYGISTVQLEPLMNVFLIGALAAIVPHPTSDRMRVLAGLLLAAAVLIKFTAVVAVVLLAVAELLWVTPRRATLRRQAITGAAMLAVLIPAGLILLFQPHFFDDAVRFQLLRPRTPIELRLIYLRNLTLHFPLYLGAVCMAAIGVIRARTPHIRCLALTGVLLTLALIFGFRSYYNFYLIVALPWLVVPLAAAIGPLTHGRGRYAEPALTVLCIVGLAVAGPLLKATAYRRALNNPNTSPVAIVMRLREGQGYLYANNPAFALVSGRELYPWYYQADSYLPRLVGRIGDDEFLRVAQGCDALVLWPDELNPYPATRAYIEQHYTVAITTASQVLWLRREQPPAPAGE